MTELLIAVLIALSAVLGGADDAKSMQTLDNAIMELHTEIRAEQREQKREEKVQPVKVQEKAKKAPARVPGSPWASEA